jgi:hypothetical protein
MDVRKRDTDPGAAESILKAAYPNRRLLERAGVVLGVTLIAMEASAQGFQQDIPIPSTANQSLTAIQLLFNPAVPPPLTLFPEFRDKLKDAPPFLSDAKGEFNFRSYYRDQLTDGVSTAWRQAWAAGGWAGFESGRILNVISGGAVFYTSLPLYAPDDQADTGLLRPGQQAIAVVGQLYGQLHLNETTRFTAGRYIWDTPFLGPNDNRMIPNTFYGYALQGTLGTPEDGPAFRYGAGYIAAIKDRASPVFISMSRQAGALDVDNGVGVAGALMTWGSASLGAVEYYCQDIINIAYAEGKYGPTFPIGVSTILALQYADQRSTGANLLTGSYFQTDQFGTRLQAGYQTGILTAAYSVVDPNFTMQTPWSANPFYTDALVLHFNRAGENAILVGGSYDFTPLGLQGVATAIQYFRGWTGAPAAGLPLVEDEWDFNVEWRPNWRPLSGFWLRARYGRATTNQSNAFTTVDEVRVILNYKVKHF